MPAPLAIGQFSIAFALPFLIAAWAWSRRDRGNSLGHLLYGGRGNGLWVETACIAVAILFAGLSMPASPEPARAFRVFLPMAYGVCALVIFRSLPPLLGRRLIYALLFSGALVIALGLAMTPFSSLQDRVMIAGYRFRGFFDNSNQLSLAITALWPVLIALTLSARSGMSRAVCLLTILVLGYALFFSGTKTGLAICFASTCILIVYYASRTGSLDSAFVSLALVLTLLVLSLPLLLMMLSWASPIAFEKVNSIFAGGIADYQSIRSRNLIWEESLRIGMASPWVGEGAGARILEKSHSHNMILDYFRGMGVFGMMSALVLLLAAGVRTVGYLVSTWGKGRTDRTRESIIMALYLGAFGYLIGNQLSDSFSPSTAFIFWAAYVCAYVSAAPAARRIVRARAVRARDWYAGTIRGDDERLGFG